MLNTEKDILQKQKLEDQVGVFVWVMHHEFFGKCVLCAGLCFCLSCAFLSFSFWPLLHLCCVNKVLLVVFIVYLNVFFLCACLSVGEAEQIKPVSSLIVFTVSSTQSVISTQTTICPNNRL